MSDIKKLAQRLTEIAAKAFANAAPGKPAATILIEKEPATGAAIAAEEAAARLGIPMLRVMATTDLMMGDFASQVLNTEHGATQSFITKTVFDAGKKTGGILYIDGSQRLSETTSKGLAQLIDGDLSGLPPMSDINLDKWIIVLAQDLWDDRQTLPDLRTKANVKILDSGLMPRP